MTEQPQLFCRLTHRLMKRSALVMEGQNKKIILVTGLKHDQDGHQEYPQIVWCVQCVIDLPRVSPSCRIRRSSPPPDFPLSLECPVIGVRATQTHPFSISPLISLSLVDALCLSVVVKSHHGSNPHLVLAPCLVFLRLCNDYGSL